MDIDGEQMLLNIWMRWLLRIVDLAIIGGFVQK